MSDVVTGRLVVSREVCDVLRAVRETQLHAAASMFSNRDCRWFCSGQGRSGLVAQMAAMRLMHLGFDAHTVGEATAPAINHDNGMIVISRSGETPVTVHFSKLARDIGSQVLAVTERPDSTITRLATNVITVPERNSRQFGGSLFEQCALLTLDALIFDIASTEPAAYQQMSRRHSNLQ